jgi:hypothetical protein
MPNLASPKALLTAGVLSMLCAQNARPEEAGIGMESPRYPQQGTIDYLKAKLPHIRIDTIPSDSPRRILPVREHVQDNTPVLTYAYCKETCIEPLLKALYSCLQTLRATQTAEARDEILACATYAQESLRRLEIALFPEGEISPIQKLIGALEVWALAQEREGASTLNMHECLAIRKNLQKAADPLYSETEYFRSTREYLERIYSKAEKEGGAPKDLKTLEIISEYLRTLQKALHALDEKYFQGQPFHKEPEKGPRLKRPRKGIGAQSQKMIA